MCPTPSWARTGRGAAHRADPPGPGSAPAPTPLAPRRAPAGSRGLRRLGPARAGARRRRPALRRRCWSPSPAGGRGRDRAAGQRRSSASRYRRRASARCAARRRRRRPPRPGRRAAPAAADPRAGRRPQRLAATVVADRSYRRRAPTAFTTGDATALAGVYAAGQRPARRDTTAPSALATPGQVLRGFAPEVAGRSPRPRPPAAGRAPTGRRAAGLPRGAEPAPTGRRLPTCRRAGQRRCAWCSSRPQPAGGSRARSWRVSGSARRPRRSQRRREVRVGERVAGCLEHLAARRAGRPGRSSGRTRPAPGASRRRARAARPAGAAPWPSAAVNSALVTGLGRGQVDRPGDGGGQQEADRTDLVPQADPRPVLPAAAHPAAEPEPEHRRASWPAAPPRPSTSPVRSVTTRTPAASAGAVAASQLDAHAGEEVVPGRRRLVDRAVTGVAVAADRRGGEQHPRPARVGRRRRRRAPR